MRAEISGQSGFIGSHLTEVLSAKGWEVKRIKQEVLYSPSDLEMQFRTDNPDYIFHCAAYGNMSNQKDVAMTVFANIIGTYNMLYASRNVPYKVFVNMGSSSEYGKSFKAMSEKDRLQPESLYGASKAGATHLAYAFAKQFDKPILTIRPFSVYGPGEADFRFIPTVIRSILSNQAFPLDAQANHDWIYIDDFIDAVFVAMDKQIRVPDGVVNVGSGRMHTNKEVCDLLKQITGVQYLATPYGGMRPNDAEVWMSDNTEITRLGWFPKVMLKEGLERTYKFYKEKYGAKI